MVLARGFRAARCRLRVGFGVAKLGQFGDSGWMKQLVIVFSLFWSLASWAEERAPNIVFVLADDLGYMDIAAFAAREWGVGREVCFYETPHLDRLADEGVAFSNFYACQLCSPTRASILTGRNAATIGFTTATPFRETYYNTGTEVPAGHQPHDVLVHEDRIAEQQAWINGQTNTALPEGVATLPEVLKSHDSVFLGKWHLGGHGAPGQSPQAAGFRELAWFDAGGSPFFNWRPIWSRGRADLFAADERAYQFGDPGPSTGEEYLTDDLTAQAVTYIEGRKNIEKPFFLYFCHFAVHGPWQGKEEEVDYFRKRETIGFGGHTDPVYAAMVKSLDDSIGSLVASLRATGQLENTLFLFASDNGGVMYARGESHLPRTTNLPLKGGKAHLYEGGIRVPLIAWWPGKMEGGIWNESVLHCSDFLPTLAEVTGQEAPAVDGVSFAKLMVNPRTVMGGDRTLFWHYPFNVVVKEPHNGIALSPHSAIREGRWKLIWDWHGTLRLYDLVADPFERIDLGQDEDQSPRVENLFGKLQVWLQTEVSEHYLPRLNPDYEAAKGTRPEPFVNLWKADR